jgi:hypothetical protein
MKYTFLLFLLSTLYLQSCQKNAVDAVSGTQIAEWDEAPHNGFTDLIRFEGVYYCVFREGNSHDSYDGKIRIIKSLDGTNWTGFSLLSLPEKDLRDPHFFVDINNLLSIGTNARDRNNARENFVYKLQNEEFIQSNKGNTDHDYWLWSFTKNEDSVYSIGYNTKQPCFSTFFNSAKSKIMLFKNAAADCISFDRNTDDDWIPKNFECPCEASMVFTSDSTLVAIVRDENTPGRSHIGVSKKPFKTWEWKNFPYFIKGPKLSLLPDGRIFLAAGSMVSNDKTYYAILNPVDFSVETIKAFPSGGDTGYPGVVIEGTTALVSYYSSHEGDSRIYIYRINY